MKNIDTALKMLGLIARPAFVVSNNQIIGANSAAQAVLAHPEISLEDVIGPEAMAQYQDFSGSSISLAVKIQDKSQKIVIDRMDGFDLFLLEDTNTPAQLQVLGIAAQQLRTPLSMLMNSSISQDPYANQAIHQLHREISNMSDVLYYFDANDVAKQAVEAKSFVNEIMDSVIKRCAQSNIAVTYTGLDAPISCALNCDMVERALLNLIANAIKAHGQNIHVKLTAERKMLHFNITDDGMGINPAYEQNIFSHYNRAPGTFSNTGIGLGLSLASLVAQHHGGTLIIKESKETGSHLLMTLKIEPPEFTVRSGFMRQDYLSGRDHILTELSGVLSSKVF